MRLKYFILAFMALVLLPQCQKDTIVPENIEQELINEIHEKGIASVAISIVSDKQILWEWVYGYANIKDSKAADRNTLYQLMSISKVFIAVSVLQLVEEGKLNLDNDINEYLPNAYRNPNHPDVPITVQMLMNHTSSLAWPDGEYWDGDFYHLYDRDKMPLLAEWLPEFLLPKGSSYRHSIWKGHKPGEKELYSNIATSLLALVVEEISGLSYPEYCSKNIFEPLEMNNSGFLYSDVDEELIALPYYSLQTAYHLYNNRHYPAANLKSNLEDFSHFMIAMLNKGKYESKRILSEASVAKMFEINNIGTGISLIWKHCPGDCIGHSGGGEGFSTRFELYPDRNMAMIILSNRRNSSVYPQERIYNLVRLKVNQY